jgi:2,4-dienoyl-CoA reductase-like NADH-dependent reductase (Old Yellow Enzyme family)
MSLPPESSYAPLFTPLGFLHGPEMPNRFMLAPLTNQQSHPDGTLSDDEHRWLTMRATGGFGLTMTCATHVQAVGQGFPGQLGIFGDQHIAGHTRLAADIAATGSLAYAQLHHAGNRSPADLIGSAPVCPSDDPATGARALTTAEVEQVIEDFVTAAVRCERAGYHGVELHGAHGYLICQFLSSELNQRTDQYGGSLENRSRMLFEIIDQIRARCSHDFALAVRLSPERFGMQIDEITEIYARLVDSGHVDMIDMSLWDFAKQPIEEAHQGRTLTEIFAALPRGEVRLGVAGKIHDPADALGVIQSGVDIAVLGRVAILHHDYPRQLAADHDFIPRRIPVSAEVLRSEGLSDTFVTYMNNWPGFVAQPDHSEATH